MKIMKISNIEGLEILVVDNYNGDKECDIVQEHNADGILYTDRFGAWYLWTKMHQLPHVIKAKGIEETKKAIEDAKKTIQHYKRLGWG